MTYVLTVPPLNCDRIHRPPLIVEEVHKTYGPTPVLQGLSLQLEAIGIKLKSILEIIQRQNSVMVFVRNVRQSFILVFIKET